MHLQEKNLKKNHLICKKSSLNLRINPTLKNWDSSEMFNILNQNFWKIIKVTLTRTN
jgi:hypothetical protein